MTRATATASTRQNIEFNWPKLEQVPDILADLATVQMHAIQTSGNCIRNVTADHLAGVAADELLDPRPYCEITRQWSTFHPEFNWLPRKFKIAFSSSTLDRAATRVHDIGVHIRRNEAGELGYSIYVGGGLGRMPMIAHKIREFLHPKLDLFSYLRSDPARVQPPGPPRQHPPRAHQGAGEIDWRPAKFTEHGQGGMAATEAIPTCKHSRKISNACRSRFDQHSLPRPTVATPMTAATKPVWPATARFAAWAKRNLARPSPARLCCRVRVAESFRLSAPGDITDQQFDALADLGRPLQLR